jgi:uncharacterized membrane protein YtjA (UPF0391 family)
MLFWTLAYLILALLSAMIGFSGFAGSAALVAKLLFVAFGLLFAVSLFRVGAQGSA